MSSQKLQLLYHKLQTPKKLKLSAGESVGGQSAASGVAVWLLHKPYHLMLLKHHTHGHEVTAVK